VKDRVAKVYDEGALPATRIDLDLLDEKRCHGVERGDGIDQVHGWI